MAQELALFGDGKNLTVPSHIAEVYKPEETNLLARDRMPTLTIRGKVFSITANGDTTKLMKTDSDGDVAPVSTLPVVVLGFNQKRGRSYYEGSFDPDNTAPPKCYSRDSITPDDEVEEKQSPKCATCQWSAKNSRTNDAGEGTVACQQFRILAVVPVKRMDLPPLRLRIAVTSDYDGRSKDLMEQGLFAFSNYLDFIRVRGVPHSQAIVTKLKFDVDKAYPKLLFSAARWLEPEEVARVKELVADGGIDTVLGNTQEIHARAMDKAPEIAPPKSGPTPEEIAAKAKAEEEAAKAAEKERKKQEKAAAKKAEDDAKAAAKAAADAEAAKAKSAEGVGDLSNMGDDDDDDGKPATTAAAPKATTAAAPKTTPTAVTADVPEDVAKLLGEWED